MRFFNRQGWGRTLLLLTCLVVVVVIAKTAWAKTVCNACKGTGFILELTRPCPCYERDLLNQAMCAGMNGCKGGFVGPACRYCGGTGVILSPAEKEALRKIQLEKEAQAERARQEEERAEQEAEAKKEQISSYFTDSRDGQKYRTIKIGGKTWMAQNLNYQAENSKYGGLYDWNTAKNVCPKGWYLPSSQDWEDLVTAAGGKEVAGKTLRKGRAISGFDVYGFSALLGGYRDDRYRDQAEKYGYWWTVTESSSDNAYVWYMNYSSDYVTEKNYKKSNGYSVRCVTDDMQQPSKGGRSKVSILEVVQQRMGTLLYIYQTRLRINPRLSGKIVVEFSINGFGEVISTKVLESTVNDSELEKAVVNQVKGWKFGQIDNRSDVTTITYPFEFSR